MAEWGGRDCSWDDTKNVSFQAVWGFLSGIFIFFDKKSENCFFVQN